jgi:SGNH hydrolase-like domain, acetyltransferase AlgX
MLAGVEDVKLWGVEAGAKRPALSAKAVYEETFQHEFISWFEQQWGLRGYAVRTDNTVVESLFEESRRSENLILGKDGVLLPSEDVHYVNREADPAPIIAAAERVARVQNKLRRLGRTLVPVLIPAKTTLVRESVPARWRNAAFGATDATVYRPFVRTLTAAGAKFVDGRALLMSHEFEAGVFAPHGRHWRMGPACAVLNAALDVARTEVVELGEERIDCSTERVSDPSIDDEDFDLFRLRNVWALKPADTPVFRLTTPSPPPTPAIASLSVLFQGSSFTWKFVRVVGERGAFQPSLFYYYDSSVVDTKTLFITGSVTPYTPGWREDTFSRRVMLMVMLETYLPGDGERFLVEVETAIDRGETGVAPAP